MTYSPPKPLTLSLYILIFYHSLTILISLLSVVSSLGLLSNPEQNVGIAMAFVISLVEILFSIYVIWTTWFNLKYLKTQTGNFDSIPYYIAAALCLVALIRFVLTFSWVELLYGLIYFALLAIAIFYGNRSQ